MISFKPNEQNISNSNNHHHNDIDDDDRNYIIEKAYRLHLVYTSKRRECNNLVFNANKDACIVANKKCCKYKIETTNTEIQLATLVYQMCDAKAPKS